MCVLRLFSSFLLCHKQSAQYNLLRELRTKMYDIESYFHPIWRVVDLRLIKFTVNKCVNQAIPYLCSILTNMLRVVD